MGGEALSELELRILRHVSQTADINYLAKTANVSHATLGKEVARLQLGGYITGDCRLTEKGVGAVRRG